MRPFIVLALAALSAFPVAAADPPPPVVLISIDTLRSDRLPVYGYAEGRTPAIDSLRRHGVLVERAYSHTPLTLPSHATVFGGQLPSQHGVRDNQGYTLEEPLLLTTLLRDAGYATGAAVSAWVLRGETGFAKGFDFYDDAIEARPGVALGGIDRPGPETLEAALGWLESVADQSFFLFLHLFEPHAPYEPPPPFVGRFAHPYDGEIAAADAVVGELMAALERLGVYRRALVVLFSDHGEGLGEHGEEEHGLFLYREALQVPLILKLPGNARAGQTLKQPAGLMDVLPTVLDAIGRPVPPEVDLPGRSLLAPSTEERVLVAETFYPRLRFGWSELHSAIDGPWHLVDGRRAELFDLVQDPAELRDLANQERKVVESLRQELEPHRAPPPAPAAADKEHRARLAALGYLGSAAAPTKGPLPDPRDRLASLEGLRAARRLLEAGDLEGALRAYRRVLRDEPQLLDGWLATAELLERMGRLGDALLARGRALELSGGDPHLLGDLALLEAKNGDFDAARKALDAADAAGLDVGPWRRRLARLLAAADRTDEATAELETLAAAGEKGAALDLARLALEAEDWATARRQAEAALAVDSDRAEAWNLLGVALRRLNEVDKALDAWQRALGLAPEDWDTLYNLGTEAAAAGQKALAQDALARFVAGAPAERYRADLVRARVLLRRLER